MKIKFLSIIVIAVFIISCKSTQRLNYLQDMAPGRGYIIQYKHETVINKGDRIDVSVSSSSPELAVPFNTQHGVIEVSREGQISPTNKNATKSKGYLVDNEGNIDFPVLGLIQVEGLSLSELTTLIKNKIISGNYIKEPIVTAEFVNFKFYVLGEVASKGVHSVDYPQLTLLEALSIAGDITPNGRADRVAVIRKSDDSSILYMHDLQSKDIFESPAYYLKQNDIIYVESKQIKRSTEDSMLRYFTLTVSTISTILTLILLSRQVK